MHLEIKRVRDVGDSPEGCTACGTPRKERQCCVCGVIGLVIDCGHMKQPRPIASGRADGSDLGYDFCVDCAQEKEEASDGT